MGFRKDEILSIANRDLTKRARGSIVIYLLAWLIITLPYQYPHQHADFFYFNTFIFGLILIARLAHLTLYLKNPTQPTTPLYPFLTGAIMVAALHWGLVTFWALMHDSYADISILLTLTASTLGLASSITLSISDVIRRFYALAILVPIICGLIYQGSVQSYVMAVMGGLLLGYAFIASKIANQDYWQAIINQTLVEKRAAQMELLSITDQLTSLNNRSFFDRRLHEVWKRATRQQTNLSLLILDLDHFKAINDNYGHLYGDQCLKLVGEVLLNSFHRETDIVARYGGEEFVIMLPDASVKYAAIVAERVRLAIADIKLLHEGVAVNVTCSIGGSTIVPEHSLNPDALIKQADDALYLAKKNGRNQYHQSEHAGLMNSA